MVAMSGGVDSSVAASLLVRQGFQVTGMTMCLGIDDLPQLKGVKCCGTEAINDARKVCDTLGIDHYVLNFSKELKIDVIDNFVEEYSRGRTPNPCVRCNEYLKFGKLLKQSLAMGYDFLATGHYARIDRDGTEPLMKKASDLSKDQTYFLYAIKKEFLKHVLFPLDRVTKPEVREIAGRLNLHVAEKPQSQDICFIPDNDYKTFIGHCGAVLKEGDIVDVDGKVLGRHTGLMNYTVGQRKGLGIAHPYPLYVIRIDIEKNQVVAGAKELLCCKSFFMKEMNLLVDCLPAEFECRTRFRGRLSRCRVEQDSTGYRVIFDGVHDAVSPGQSAVFYLEDTVLGGGIIDSC